MPKSPSPVAEDINDLAKTLYKLQSSEAANDYFSSTSPDVVYDPNDPNSYSSRGSANSLKPQLATRSNTAPNPPKDTYANRAVKVTGDAFARFSKAIIGNSNSNNNSSSGSGSHGHAEFPTSGRSSEASSRETSIVGSHSNTSLGAHRASTSISQRPTYSRANSSNFSNATNTTSNGLKHFNDTTVKRSFKYTANSEIMAMGPAATENAVAIAGKDFFQVLRIENDTVSVGQDLRGTYASRDFDKFYSVTDLSWGRHEYRRTIALSNSCGQLFVYNIEITKSVNRLSDGTRAINSVQFHPNESAKLASGSADGSIKLWDLRQHKKNPVISFFKNGDNAREVQFSPFDNNKLASIYDSGSIIRWDVRYPRITDRRLNGHTGAGLSFDWHTEYDYIVSGGVDKQIHVWNMGSESRKPEITISNSAAVSKVRWQHDILNSTASSKYGVLNSDIVSCNMSLFDNSVTVWNPRRPHIPHYVLHPHNSSVNDVFWRSQSVLWTISKDKTFAQTALDPNQMEIKNLNSQAFSWTIDNRLSFVAQDRHEEMYYKDASDNTLVRDEERAKKGSSSIASSPSMNRSPLPPVSLPTESMTLMPAIYSVNFPGDPLEAFDYCAENYFYYDNVLSLERYSKKPLTKAEVKRTTTGLMAVDICGNNSIAAARAGKFRTSQTWKVLQEVVGRERIEFLQHIKPKKTVKDKLKPYAFKIAESLQSAEPSPMLRPLDDTHSNLTSISRNVSLDRSYAETQSILPHSLTRDDTGRSVRHSISHPLTSDADEYESYSESSDEYESSDSSSPSSSSSALEHQPAISSTLTNALSNLRTNAENSHSRTSLNSLSRQFSNTSNLQQHSHSEDSSISHRGKRVPHNASQFAGVTHRSNSRVSIPSNLRNQLPEISESNSTDVDTTTNSIVDKLVKNENPNAAPQTWADILDNATSNKEINTKIGQTAGIDPSATKLNTIFSGNTPQLHSTPNLPNSVSTVTGKKSIQSSVLPSPSDESVFSNERETPKIQSNVSMTPQLSDIARAVAEYASYNSEASDEEPKKLLPKDDESDTDSNVEENTQQSALRTFLTKTISNASKASDVSSKRNSSIFSRTSVDGGRHDESDMLQIRIKRPIIPHTDEDTSVVSGEYEDDYDGDKDNGYESMGDDTDDDEKMSKTKGKKGYSLNSKEKKKTYVSKFHGNQLTSQRKKGKRPVLEESVKPAEEVNNGTAAVTVTRATQFDDLTKQYHDYQNTIEHPWRAEKMIQKAAWYAAEQGDIQMCATLGMLFLRDYPRAFISNGESDSNHISTLGTETSDQDFASLFKSKSSAASKKPNTNTNNNSSSFSDSAIELLEKGSRVVEEWVVTYIETLRRHGQNTTAAEIIKQCPFPKVQQRGEVDTSLDLICRLCGSLLTENRAKFVPATTNQHHGSPERSHHRHRNHKQSKVFQVPENKKALMGLPDLPKHRKRKSVDSKKISFKTSSFGHSSQHAVADDYNDSSSQKFGYWYCITCDKLLNGCSYCSMPVKGLGICLFGCGHKIHISCLRQWANECGEVLDPLFDYFYDPSSEPKSGAHTPVNEADLPTDNIQSPSASEGLHPISSTPSFPNLATRNSADSANFRSGNFGINAANINNIPRAYNSSFLHPQESPSPGFAHTANQNAVPINLANIETIYPSLECPTGCGTIITM